MQSNAAHPFKIHASGAVLVTRHDHSSNPSGSNVYDASDQDTAAVKFVYRVTFVLALNEGAVKLMTTDMADTYNTINVSLQKVGYTTSSTGSANISPSARVPSGPQNVQLSVVSDDNLGVYWEGPATNGGAEVAKVISPGPPLRLRMHKSQSRVCMRAHTPRYTPIPTQFLVEWDTDYTMNRPVYSPSRAYSTVTDYAAVVNATRSTRESDAVAYQYQITGLNLEDSYDVRVSAYNSLGYGVSVVTSPKEVNPAVVPLYVPTEIQMNTSAAQIPNRIDLSFVEPTVDVLGFDTENKGAYTGNTADYYRIQWSEDKSFENLAGTYDWRTKSGENSQLLCESACNVDLGAEVHTITTHSHRRLHLLILSITSNPILTPTGPRSLGVQ